MHRRDFLLGNMTGLVVGVGAAFATSRLAAVPPPPLPSCDGRAKTSYAQQGEDLVIASVFEMMKIGRPTYIDIGGWDPVIGSNTYLFYMRGCRGVLVEPNPVFVTKLEAARPDDAVVAAGIGVTGATEADYYVVEGDGQRNTFSKEQVEELRKATGHDVVKQVVKMPLRNVNDVLKEHFDVAPSLFSVDTEGLDGAILESLDFDRWRPKVFCVETSMVNGAVDERIVTFMKSKGFSARGATFVNTVFVDNRATG